jgi:hypothetical protein
MFTEILLMEFRGNEMKLESLVFQDIQLDNEFVFPLELHVMIKYYQSEETTKQLNRIYFLINLLV